MTEGLWIWRDRVATQWLQGVCVCVFAHHTHLYQFPSVDKPDAVSFDKSLAPVRVKFVCIILWNVISGAGTSKEKVKRDHAIRNERKKESEERQKKMERQDKSISGRCSRQDGFMDGLFYFFLAWWKLASGCMSVVPIATNRNVNTFTVQQVAVFHSDTDFRPSLQLL